MPGADPRHPRPACVEDWDDDAQTTLSSTKATANVAAKRSSSGLYADPAQLKYTRDGSDSGYSSKAGTVASASTNGKKPSNLSIDTSLLERERHPYSMTPQAQQNIRRDSFRRTGAAEYAPKPVREKRFVHPTGVCWTCDQIGYHVDAAEYARLMQPPTPASPKVNKKSTKTDQENESKLRRMSSTRESRPASIYPPSATQGFYPTNPVCAGSGYSTPITPQTQMPYGHDPMVYSNVATPMTSQYVGYQGQSDYFAPHPSEKQRPGKPKKRSSTYGEPVIQQSPKDEVRVTERTKEARPTVKSHKSSRSVDQQRADKEAMPPPDRPNQRAEVARRPSIKNSATYNTTILDHRRSRGPDDYDYKETKVSARQPSPIRDSRPPPSAYKHVAQAEPAPSRPRVQRKSVSYSDPITIPNIATSKAPESPTHHPRRNTAPTKQPDSLEQKHAEAEAYIQHKSKLTSEQLTAEKMAEIKSSSKRTMSSRSETGSAFSHHSHQSSSKGSSGRERSHTSGGQRTSILLDGGIKLDIPKDYMDRTGRPLSMQFGDLSISLGGNKDKQLSSSSSHHGKREQKLLLEKAPSVASHTSASKRSMTDSSSHTTSSKGKEKIRDDPDRLSRRTSHISDSRPPVSGSTSHGHNSQRSSRAPSATRASGDYSKSMKTQSVDYDQSRFMYGA